MDLNDLEKPFIIREVVGDVVMHPRYVAMASVEECLEFIRLIKKSNAQRIAYNEQQRATAEHQEFRQQVLERFGYDIDAKKEEPTRYLICRISHTLVEGIYDD